MVKFKKTYRVFSSGMVEGRCRRARHIFDVGARNKKHALEILKKSSTRLSSTLLFTSIIQIWEYL